MPEERTHKPNPPNISGNNALGFDSTDLMKTLKPLEFIKNNNDGYQIIIFFLIKLT